MGRKWKRLDRKVALFGLFGVIYRDFDKDGKEMEAVGLEKDGFLENKFWTFKLLDSVLLADKINV